MWLENMRKSWVILLFNDKKLKVWRTYEDNIWDSPLYTVMGYYDGSYRDAVKFAKEYLV